MADYAPDATPRYVATYTSVGRTHTAMLRVHRGVSPAAGAAQARVAMGDFFSELSPLMSDDFAFTSAVYYEEDSDIGLPVTAPAVGPGAISAALFSKQDGISHLTFSGRGVGGSKVNIKVFGVAFNPDDLPTNPASDFVITAADNADVAGAIADLAAADGLSAIDDTDPIWYPRATLKVNDHWLRTVRQGG